MFSCHRCDGRCLKRRGAWLQQLDRHSIYIIGLSPALEVNRLNDDNRNQTLLHYSDHIKPQSIRLFRSQSIDASLRGPTESYQTGCTIGQRSSWRQSIIEIWKCSASHLSEEVDSLIVKFYGRIRLVLHRSARPFEPSSPRKLSRGCRDRRYFIHVQHVRQREDDSRCINIIIFVVRVVFFCVWSAFSMSALFTSSKTSHGEVMSHLCSISLSDWSRGLPAVNDRSKRRPASGDDKQVLARGHTHARCIPRPVFYASVWQSSGRSGRGVPMVVC